jgi:uncharacterized protein
MSALDFPFRIDGRGRVAASGGDDHVRDMIHQVLFTRPGERVNRPDFGCGIQQMVFNPNSEVVAATTQFLVHGALHRWLGDLIDVAEVRVVSVGERLFIDVRYLRKDTGEARDERFAVPSL